MNNRAWVMGSLLLSAVILIGGWFIGVSPMLAASARADSDRVAVEATNQQNEQTLAELKTQYADLPRIEGELEVLRVALPSQSEIADFLGLVHTVQLSSGGFVSDVTVADAAPYAPVLPEPVEPVAPPSEDVATAEGTVEADAAASATPTPVAAVVPVLPTAGIPNAELVTATNLSLIPVSISVDGTMAQVMDFVEGMQQSERLFLVTGLNVTQDESTKLFTGVVNGFLYVFGDTAEESMTATATVN